MLFPAKDHWTQACTRIRCLLTGEDAIADLMEASRERVLQARERHGRAMPRPTGRLRQEPPSQPKPTDVPARHYLAVILDANRSVTTYRLPACCDDEAWALAQARAEGRPVDLWDGLRLIDGFAPLTA